MPTLLRNRSRYQARVGMYGTYHYIGVFRSYEEAVKAEEALRSRYQSELISEGLNRNTSGGKPKYYPSEVGSMKPPIDRTALIKFHRGTHTHAVVTNKTYRWTLCGFGPFPIEVPPTSFRVLNDKSLASCPKCVKRLNK